MEETGHGCGRRHMLAAEDVYKRQQQEGDGWLIRSHSQFDPLVSTLLYAYMEEYADGQWDPERFRGLDFTQDYIDAVPGYLEQVVEQAELRQQQAAEETTAASRS